MYSPELVAPIVRRLVDDRRDPEEGRSAFLDERPRASSLTSGLDPVIDEEDAIAGVQCGALESERLPAAPR